MTILIFIILQSSIWFWLFLVASGLTLIYGVMKVLNVAHGSLYAFGAYFTAWLIGWFINKFLFRDFYISNYTNCFLNSRHDPKLIIEKFFKENYFRDEIVIVLAPWAFLIFEEP